jgi:hypothetical protein
VRVSKSLELSVDGDGESGTPNIGFPTIDGAVFVNQRDWFRNTSWDAKIENAFSKKLARARGKRQYLRIQASILASRCPEVALRLLDDGFHETSVMELMIGWRIPCFAIGKTRSGIMAG